MTIKMELVYTVKNLGIDFVSGVVSGERDEREEKGYNTTEICF
jgi:hypothetical protein